VYVIYPAFLANLLVTGNIEGNGDDWEDTPNRSYKTTAPFTEVEPLNGYQSSHILLAALLFPK
jgi:hypothetical protein